MKKLLTLAALFALVLPGLAIADSYSTVPGSSLAAKWDTTTGAFVSLGVNGQPTSQTPLPTLAGTNVFSGTNTFTAPVINSATGIGQNALATSTTQTSLASTTTLADITGLSVPVVAGATYDCVGFLYTTSAANAGAKIAFIGENGMTATSTIYKAALFNTTTAAAVTTAMSSTTTFGAGLGATTTVNAAQIDGSVVVNAGGNLVLQGAQNASQSTGTVFLAGSNLNCVRTN